VSIERKPIAVVDDDPFMLKALERLLPACGFEVLVFGSAEAFLGSNAANDVACLVLDINLGGISGIELARRLTASGYRLPIIFITAVDNAATREKASATGGAAYLAKPFPATLLISAIEEAVGD
jgi:FixJ family two-component response regulator